MERVAVVTDNGCLKGVYSTGSVAGDVEIYDVAALDGEARSRVVEELERGWKKLRPVRVVVGKSRADELDVGDRVETEWEKVESVVEKRVGNHFVVLTTKDGEGVETDRFCRRDARVKRVGGENGHFEVEGQLFEIDKRGDKVETEYLTPDRTIEELSFGGYAVYNDGGTHYRLFGSIDHAEIWLEKGDDAYIAHESETKYGYELIEIDDILSADLDEESEANLLAWPALVIEAEDGVPALVAPMEPEPNSHYDYRHGVEPFFKFRTLEPVRLERSGK